MKKVVLLGDSIRLIGYGKKVPELLGDGYSVWQPQDNCRFSAYLLRGVFDWRADITGADVIHWNCGEWDVCNLFGDGPFTAPEVYVSNCLRIARELQKMGKKLIFATTTPTRIEHKYNRNNVIQHYNALVVPRLAEMGIGINDLYSTVIARLNEYVLSTDGIHLTDAGILACAEETAAVIRRAAEEA